MGQEAAQRPFQVDLRGVVDLLSRHIYSTPQVYLRELLQNGVDAVAARALLDPKAPEGAVTLRTTDDGGLSITDNGVGLTLDEATELLATVGRSSKRDEVLNLRREDFLGQFGIGLLSCFLVADQIRVLSRSAQPSSPAVEWLGSAEGTFSVRELTELTDQSDQAVPVGTTVFLRARPDKAELLSPESVLRLASQYGQYLPLSLEANGRRINRPAAFLETDEQEILDLGTELLGVRPLDWLRLDVPGTNTQGIAYVLPSAPAPNARQANRVYLGRMLLGERVDDLLPEWAFFVRCVVNSNGLQPTASREQFVNDAALEFTREELGAALKRWIVQLATTQPRRFDQFLSVHQLALKSLCLHDDELARVVLPWLSVETAVGRMNLSAVMTLAAQSGGARYTETVDEFRQIAAVVPTEMTVINGGYAYETELLRRLTILKPELLVQRIRVSDVLDELDVPDLADRQLTSTLETRAERALFEAGCKVSARLFKPEQLPALYVADPEVLKRLERGKSAEIAPTLWAGIMADVDRQLNQPSVAGDEKLRSRLCLNWANPLIRELSTVADEVVFGRTVRLLYVQAMLEGHRPLASADRAMLTGSLSDLIHLSVSAEFN